MPNNIVYHYTSIEAFLNIIKTKSFRLTDIEKSNDSMEKKLVVNTLLNLMRDTFNRIGTASLLKPAIKEAIEIIENGKDFYSFACCFSGEKDSLSQWRGYADEAKGVAIGIDKSKINFSTSRYQFLKSLIIQTRWRLTVKVYSAKLY